MPASSDIRPTRALVAALQRAERHRVPDRAGADRVAFGVVGVEEVIRGGPVHHPAQLPPEVHRVLHAEAEPLAAGRVVHVRRVARQQHAAAAVRRRLPRHVGEA
jgi:hypothetical protein